MRLTRYYMYKRIKAAFEKPICGKILGITSIKHFYFMIDMANSEITETTYPEVDMQKLPFPDNHFDIVISDQVIEHLENPQKAILESYRVLKKGGMAIHTTCLINHIHQPAPDYWRFTPKALSYLSRYFSKIIQCEGWGNRIAIFLCFLSEKFRSIKIRDNGISLFRPIAQFNESKFSITTWIIAQK